VLELTVMVPGHVAAEEVEKFPSPLYEALIECEPGANELMLMLAWPPETEAEPSKVPLS
jgi:hypothetical protein